MNDHKRPDYDAFGRDVLPALTVIVVLFAVAFAAVILAYRLTIAGSIPDYRAQGTPWGASPNRPPYSATNSP